MLVPWSIRSSLQLLHQIRLLCSSMLHLLVLPLENSSAIRADLPSSFMMIFQNRPLLTVKSPCCFVVLRAVKLTPVTYSTCTAAYWKELQRLLETTPSPGT